MGTKKESRHESRREATTGGTADLRQEADASGVDGTGGAADAQDTPGFAPMRGAPIAIRPCSIAAALEVIGEKWSLLALRELSYGVHRFAQIVGYTGAPRDILTDRLRKLEAAGIVERRLYNEHPPRYEYHQTQAGRELFPMMISLLDWGDKWAVEKPAVLFRHTCGEQVSLDLRCGHCGETLTRASLTAFRPGAEPGTAPQR
jgi:DNA-binding HxlR family transcriptional regulator